MSTLMLISVLSAVYVTPATSWTVDLAEVTKHLDLQHRDLQHRDLQLQEMQEDDDDVSYEYAANKDGYQSLSEKKASSGAGAGAGGAYLEALSGALAQLRASLARCAASPASSTNTTGPTSPTSPTSPTAQQLVDGADGADGADGVGGAGGSCSSAAARHAQAQRLVDEALALLRAAPEGSAQYENELVLRLGALLQRLALLARTAPAAPAPRPSPQPGSSVSEETTTKAPETSTTSQSDTSLELLEQVENNLLSKLAPKAAPAQASGDRRVRKRSAPLSDVVNYYVKFKAWDASNSLNTSDRSKYLNDFDVENYLKVKPVGRSTRSVVDNREIKLNN